MAGLSTETIEKAVEVVLTDRRLRGLSNNAFREASPTVAVTALEQQGMDGLTAQRCANDVAYIAACLRPSTIPGTVNRERFGRMAFKPEQLEQFVEQLRTKRNS
jgi:hypothetical protein